MKRLAIDLAGGESYPSGEGGDEFVGTTAWHANVQSIGRISEGAFEICQILGYKE
jgi:hypothetical protein